jgi:hypothetical protein
MPESDRIRKRSTFCTLSDEVVAHSAAYLSPPSQALFAISQCCTPQATQLIVAHTEWGTLDFGLLEAETASKLTDDDLAQILNLIKARDNLKTLKLTGCVGILGHGLKPLSNSTVLEEMDLHRFERSAPRNIYRLDPQKSMMLGEATVVPILSSMLPPNLPGLHSSLLLVRYPKHWRDKKSAILTEFLQVFDGVLKNRNYRCCWDDDRFGKCDLPCCGDSDEDDSDNVEIFINQEGDMYGIANHICTRCKNTFCERTCPLDYCEDCEHHSCIKCCPTVECEECNKIPCGECSPVLWCEHCGTANCLDCDPFFTPFCSKEGCYCHSCIECFKVWPCDRCDESFCFDCASPNAFQCCEMYCCTECICDCGDMDFIGDVAV